MLALMPWEHLGVSERAQAHDKDAGGARWTCKVNVQSDIQTTMQQTSKLRLVVSLVRRNPDDPHQVLAVARARVWARRLGLVSCTVDRARSAAIPSCSFPKLCETCF